MKRRIEKESLRQRGVRPHGWLLGLAVACLASASAGTAPTPRQESSKVGLARTALEKWVEARQTIAKERQDWELGRQLVEDQISLMQSEIEKMKSEIEKARGSIASADQEREELLTERGRLVEASDKLRELAVLLEKRIQDLLARLPAPALARIELLAPRIPDDPEQSEEGLGQRFLVILGLLGELNKFHRDVTLSTEVRALSDGTSAEVSVLYLGLGRAYFVSNDGSVAGYSRSTPEGWTWVEDDSIADAVTRAIKIFQNEDPAQFVQLPLHID